jgi:hypothetical protein
VSWENSGRKAAASVALTGSLLLVGGALAGPASAARPIQIQDGLVNVAVGDVEVLNDVNVGVAAQVAANLCDVTVKNVAVLATIVDRSGDSDTVCETDQGDVVIRQN